MIEELTTIMTTAAGVIASLGGIGAVIYRRQSKRLKEAEASLAEANAKKMEADVMEEQITMLSSLNKQLLDRNTQLVTMNTDKETRHQTDMADWQQRYDAQTERLRSVQDEHLKCLDHEKEYLCRIAAVEKERDFYKQWHCCREFGEGKDKCVRRKPKQPVPLKYVPLDDASQIEN
jgi:hypothetical protein